MNRAHPQRSPIRMAFARGGLMRVESTMTRLAVRRVAVGRAGEPGAGVVFAGTSPAGERGAPVGLERAHAQTARSAQATRALRRTGSPPRIRGKAYDRGSLTSTHGGGITATPSVATRRRRSTTTCRASAASLSAATRATIYRRGSVSNRALPFATVGSFAIAQDDSDLVTMVSSQQSPP